MSGRLPSDHCGAHDAANVPMRHPDIRRPRDDRSGCGGLSLTYDEVAGVRAERATRAPEARQAERASAGGLQAPARCAPLERRRRDRRSALQCRRSTLADGGVAGEARSEAINALSPSLDQNWQSQVVYARFSVRILVCRPSRREPLFKRLSPAAHKCFNHDVC